MCDEELLLKKFIAANKLKIISKVKDSDFTKLYIVKNNHKRMYLKVCRSPLNIEGDIYHILSKDFDSYLPRIYSLDIHKDVCLILMEEIGKSTLKSINPNFNYTLQSLKIMLEVHEKYKDNFSCFEQCNIKDKYNGSVNKYILNTITDCEGLDMSLKEKLMDVFTDSLLTQSPFTLVHGDFYCDNLVISKRIIKIIDWGFAHIGVGNVDIATIFSHHKKNGEYQITFEQMTNVYNEAYSQLNGKNMGKDEIERSLAIGFILKCFSDISWINYRINNNLWTTNTQSILINNYCSEILKYIRYL